MVDFAQLTAREAKDFLAVFLDLMPERLEALRTRSASSGGPTELDLSLSSLIPLWEWMAQEIRFRDAYAPAEAGAPQPLVDLGTIEPEEQLPEWFSDAPQRWAPFTADTLWLIDGFGRYLGEALRLAFPGAEWKVGRSRVKSYIFQNHPIVTPIPPVGDVEPIMTTFGFVRMHLDGRSGETPYETISRWTIVL